SGFRSPEFNTDLRNNGGRVAQASLHTEAMAADIMFTGVEMRRLWHDLRGLHSGGAGYYRSGKFIHLDTGPPRFGEEPPSRGGETLSAGNPRMFAPPDFARYAPPAGALIRLHSVPAFPLRIAADAALVGSPGSSAIGIEPTGDTVQSDGGCFA